MLSASKQFNVNRLFAIICLFIAPLSAAAQIQPSLCIVCGRPFKAGSTIYKHARGYLCGDCAKLPTHCSLCGIPVIEAAAKTTDGRVICKDDAPEAVIDETEARRVFSEASDEVRRIARGRMELQFPQVAVRMFDVDFWSRERASNPDDGMHTLGFSHSRKLGNDFVHNVIMLSGQLRSHLAGVAAHEYTHIWMHENVPPTRKIEPESVEAVCELLAYKLATRRGDTNSQARILQNPYTKGRIKDFVEADAYLGLDAILNWVLTGTTPKLEWRTPEMLAAASAPREAAPHIAAAPAPIPDKLLLRGILGSAKKRMALINDKTFEKDDELEVRVADKKLVVRCLDITENEVVLQVNGAQEPVRLRLGEK
ncbi:MAG: hypothetical protein AB1705_09555 [Verrucomicrobiota bacterium]